MSWKKILVNDLTAAESLAVLQSQKTALATDNKAKDPLSVQPAGQANQEKTIGKPAHDQLLQEIETVIDTIEDKNEMIQLQKTQLKTSFADRERVLPESGFVAEGFALSYEQLQQLKQTVIAYVKPIKPSISR